MEEKIFTPEQVAQILQVHQFTVLKFIKQGKLNASKLGRVYRIRQTDLENFLDETAGKKEPTSTKQTTVRQGNKKQKQKLLSSSPNQESEELKQPNESSTEGPKTGSSEAHIEIVEDNTQQSKTGGEDVYFILE